MEKTIKLRTNDNHIIYGTLNSIRQNNSRLIIFVHGLTGNKDEHHYFNAVPFFVKKGFNVFRFNFYHWENKARQLSDCSITIHVLDLMTIINHFQKRYKKIFLVGHSLGAPVILNADLNSISKIVLWDPTKGMNSLGEKDCVYDKKLNKYILQWGLEILINQDMVDDWKKASDLKTLTKKITKPCKFIFAGKNDIKNAWRPFLRFINTPHESINIAGATHIFTEKGTEKKLFQETLKWLK